MATCGYICPVCEGRGFDENLETCHFCTPEKQKGNVQSDTITEEEWMARVHEGPCCSDEVCNNERF